MTLLVLLLSLLPLAKVCPRHHEHYFHLRPYLIEFCALDCAGICGELLL